MKYELEGFGIKVILIEPGAVKTDYLDNAKQAQKAMNPDSPYEEFSKKMSAGVKERFKEASSSSPYQVAAEVILSAIKSEKPNTRYLVGNDAIAIKERRKNSSDSELEVWIKENIRTKRFLKVTIW
jgi:short-subunit dehydrogenase